MIFGVPAESGGALSILQDFFYRAMEDVANKYFFVISKPRFVENPDNVTVLRFPWIKTSWLHRLYFDRVIAPRLIRDYDIDVVLSLQNTIIPGTDVRQVLYLHNALPFVDHRFSLRQSPMLWLYQNLISKAIYNSVIKADKVIVQTRWMKEACIALNADPRKIEVCPPTISTRVEVEYKKPLSRNTVFFYPASGVLFKNHKVILEACHRLMSRSISNFSIVFTLSENENKYTKELCDIVTMHNLPVSFIGQVSRQTVFEYYSKSILLFASYIESLGLPLVEAMMHRSPIIVADCAFSREILENYDKVAFFDPFDSDQLAHIMANHIEGGTR